MEPNEIYLIAPTQAIKYLHWLVGLIGITIILCTFYLGKCIKELEKEIK